MEIAPEYMDILLECLADTVLMYKHAALRELRESFKNFQHYAQFKVVKCFFGEELGNCHQKKIGW